MLREENIGFAELNGSVPVNKRGQLIREFEENRACKVFISTEAGGSGLNLQVADTVINFELPWNPAKKNQRFGRIDRIGQFLEPEIPDSEVAEDSIVPAEIPDLDDVTREETAMEPLDTTGSATAETEVPPAEHLEQVMNQGMGFLAGLFKMATGKDLIAGEQAITIDKQTGEVTMKFRLPVDRG